jgi:hypothetical protein
MANEYKIVYKDNEKNKITRGEIVSEEEHIIKIKSSIDGNIIIIGKQFLISAVPIVENKNW